MNATEVQSLIEAGLPGAQVRVSSPDDTHFEAVIVAPQFEGKRTLQRHQLVYGTLGGLGALYRWRKRRTDLPRKTRPFRG